MVRNVKIFAFTGMPFSGKSEAVKIANDLRIPVIRMGDIVWDEVKKRGLDLTGENVGRIASEMRDEFGKNIWAKKTIEKINEMKFSETIVIDGVRNHEEIDLFKKILGSDFLLVAIVVPDEVRHQRALQRGRVDDSLDLSEIIARDNRELGWGIKKVIESSDIKIDNLGSIEQLQNNIRKIFDQK